MWVTLGLVAVVLAAALFRRRSRWTSNGPRGEWMSERWLAEHRASHTPDD
jgi:hypothetical protein